MTSKKRKNKSVFKKVLLVIWLIAAAVSTVYVLTHSSAHSLHRTGRSLLKLFVLVGSASFVGAVFEHKAWARFVAFFVKPMVKFGKLPEVSGISFITAIFSNNAANTLIAGSYADGNISRREMLVSGLCNAYPAMVSHSLRIFFPLLSAIGLAAVGYYSFTFGVGLVMTLGFLTISRVLAVRDDENISQAENLSKKISSLQTSPPWSEVLRKSSQRAFLVIVRLLYITVPVYLLVAFMSKNGMFDFWKDFIPSSVSHWLTPEIMAVMTARLGGLINAAGVASEFLARNKIENWQIVLAFMIGNIVTNPIRTIRRNLPMAMGIFPARDGLIIVLILQSLRFVFTLIGAIVLVLCMT